MLVRPVVMRELTALRVKYPKAQLQDSTPEMTPDIIHALIDHFELYGDQNQTMQVFMRAFDCSNEEWGATEQTLTDFCGCDNIFWLDERLVMVRLLNQWLEKATTEYGDCKAELEYLQLLLLVEMEEYFQQTYNGAFVILCGAAGLLGLCGLILYPIIRWSNAQLRNILFITGVVLFAVVSANIFCCILYIKTAKRLKDFLHKVGRPDDT